MGRKISGSGKAVERMWQASGREARDSVIGAREMRKGAGRRGGCARLNNSGRF